MNMALHRLVPGLLALALTVVAAGCSPYQLRGAVVEGPRPGLFIVDARDPRLTQGAMEDVSVQVTVDPDRMSPTRLPPVRTDADGRFAMPIGETGAGFLEYDAAVVARSPGYQAVTGTIKLPGQKKRLLIVMAPGRDTYRPQEDVLQETLRLGNEFLRE